MRKHVAAIALCAVLAAPDARAQICADFDRHGGLQVDVSCQSGVNRVDLRRAYRPSQSSPKVAMPAPPEAASPQRQHMHSLVEQVAREYAIDAPLLHAIVQVESNYEPRASSRAGALGLMQVIPATGQRFGADDLLDPLQNLRAGAAYLVWLDQAFRGELPLVLAAYNAGEGAVRRHGRRIPPYAETISYVRRVTALYQQAAQQRNRRDYN